MNNATVKKLFLSLSILIVTTVACDLSVTVATPVVPSPVSTNTAIPTSVSATQTVDLNTPTPEVFISLTQAIPVTAVPTATPPGQPSPVPNTLVTFGRLTLGIPSSVASGASGSDIAPVTIDDAAYWDKTPGHLQVSLNDYYVLQGKLHQPQIRVYPAMPYVELVPAAFESIHRLNNVLYDPGAPIGSDQLPPIPFFNARQVFASNVQVMSFQNGRGVRFLTEYAQYPASVNNTDLFYHFQGVTSDGAYFIVAIFPITTPVLAETSDGGAALPSGGIPYPYFADPNADMQGYYAAVTALLNATSPDAFFPSLNQLDALIQSMRITP